MKSGLFLIALFLLSCSSGRQQSSWERESTVSDAAFSREQAERILGVAVDKEEIYRSWGCLTYDKIWEYTARDVDTGTGKRGKVLVMVASTTPEHLAQMPARYGSIVRRMGLRDSNRVAGVGEEAHISRNEMRMYARQGVYTVEFIVEPTSRTTREEFLRVAGEVVAGL